MRGTVLVCGSPAEALPLPEEMSAHALPARPSKAEVDPLLGSDLVVVGSDADLAAVVLRLLRKELLDSTSVGYVPVGGHSVVAGLWGLPSRPDDALRLALSGEATPVPLIRDDAGGVLAGQGVLRRPRGVAYCDDTTVLRGEANTVVVRPGRSGLVAVITRGSVLRRKSTFEGRAFQFGGAPLTPESDGVPYPRPMERWTWYRHTHDLRLILPAR